MQTLTEKPKITKCPHCSCFILASGKALHAQDCPSNTLSKEDWKAEETRRLKNLWDCLKGMVDNAAIADKMSMKELQDYLINHTLAKTNVSGLEYAVIERVINILEDLEKERVSFAA